MSKQLVVVGGGYAGRIALGRLRMALPGARITLIDPRTHSQARIQLHRAAAGQVVPHVELAGFCDRWNAEHLRQPLLRVEDGLVLADRTLQPDGVVLAMGSRTRPPQGPALVLDDQEDADRIASALPNADRVTVIGADTTALESVTALALRHTRVRFTIWGDLPGSPVARRVLAARLEELGIDHRPGRVDGWDQTRAWDSEGSLSHDLVLWCGGFEPVTVPGLGPTGTDGRVPVDGFLQWRPGWFVAGDLGCPPVPHPMGCVTALPMGAHAATNLVHHLRGEVLEPFAFREVLRCTDLAGGQGLVEPAGSERVFSGRTGGMLKAGIFGYVRTALAAELALGRPVYR